MHAKVVKIHVGLPLTNPAKPFDHTPNMTHQFSHKDPCMIYSTRPFHFLLVSLTSHSHQTHISLISQNLSQRKQTRNFSHCFSISHNCMCSVHPTQFRHPHHSPSTELMDLYIYLYISLNIYFYIYAFLSNLSMQNKKIQSHYLRQIKTYIDTSTAMQMALYILQQSIHIMISFMSTKLPSKPNTMSPCLIPPNGYGMRVTYCPHVTPIFILSSSIPLFVHT